MKHISFLSENFQFLEAKFSVYLNRRVFVMWCVWAEGVGGWGGGGGVVGFAKILMQFQIINICSV